MDQNKVDMYVMTNQKYFPAEKIMYLKEKLAAMDESKFTMVSTVELKDPTTILLVSIFLGTLGIDRFMLGDTGMGILNFLPAVAAEYLPLLTGLRFLKRLKSLTSII